MSWRPDDTRTGIVHGRIVSAKLGFIASYVGMAQATMETLVVANERAEARAVFTDVAEAISSVSRMASSLASEIVSERNVTYDGMPDPEPERELVEAAAMQHVAELAMEHCECCRRCGHPVPCTGAIGRWAGVPDSLCEGKCSCGVEDEP